MICSLHLSSAVDLPVLSAPGSRLFPCPCLGSCDGRALKTQVRPEQSCAPADRRRLPNDKNSVDFQLPVGTDRTECYGPVMARLPGNALLAALVPWRAVSCMGALPPVDLRTVCFV